MTVLAELPPELILHVVSFLTRWKVIDPDHFLPRRGKPLAHEPELIPDLPSINALSQTNTIFHYTIGRSLYDLCASVEPLGKLALLFAVQHQLESAVDKFVAAGVSLDSEFVFQCTFCSLLCIAAALGLRGMVVKLLDMYGEEMKARVHASLDYSRTALDFAAQYGHMDIVRILAPIPLPTIPPPVLTHRHYLSLALISAVSAQNIEISGYLISEGADVNFMTDVISTPLHYAALAKNLRLVQLFLVSGADPNLHNDHRIPLIAAIGQNVDIVQALVDGGADVHVQDHSQLNVLTYCNHIDPLRFFLERGVDPNIEDDMGRTALHHLCWNGDPGVDLVELLFQFGAGPVDRPDHQGQTAVDNAMGTESPEIVKILEPLVQNPDLKLKIAAWWEAREGGN